MTKEGNMLHTIRLVLLFVSALIFSVTLAYTLIAWTFDTVSVIGCVVFFALMVLDCWLDEKEAEIYDRELDSETH